jgi:hypothetical protein
VRYRAPLAFTLDLDISHIDIILISNDGKCKRQDAIPLVRLLKKIVTIQHSSPKSHIWRILSEKRTEKCSHSHLCCAFSARFSLNLRSNLAFYQDFKIVVNRYKKSKNLCLLL